MVLLGVKSGILRMLRNGYALLGLLLLVLLQIGRMAGQVAGGRPV
jgi:hypothetical protein